MAASHPARSMTTDLLSSLQEPPSAPLAERLRPKTIDEVIGQQHLLGPGKPLRVAFESRRLHSMILWGPPGVGKTTLARLMADALDAPPLAPSAATRLIGYADGDARRLLNAYENLVANVTSGGGSVKEIDEALLEKSLGEQLRRYDKGGEQFYDTISALHKSVRGSDPDAALYWFVRMLDGGVDPRYAARRMVRMASEDIGLADPRALRMALDAAETYERLGSPEGG